MTAPDETVGSLARLYLGNILFALERTAMSLDAEGKPADAGFYRGIARELAEAHGRALRAAEAGAGDQRGEPPGRS